jgi:hypothetical protein
MHDSLRTKWDLRNASLRIKKPSKSSFWRFQRVFHPTEIISLL